MNQYILKVLPESLQAHKGFQWPQEGIVTAPDWNPTPECGGGLHGWLNGQGDYTSCNYFSPTAKWLVLSTDKVVNIDNKKVKFESCLIEFIGDQKGASEFLEKHSPEFSGPVIGKVLVSTSKLMAVGGAYSLLTGGNRATLTGGNRATLTGGDYSTLTGGAYSLLTGGDYSTLTGGYGSTLTGGNGATLTGGNRATLTGGYGSTLTGGAYSLLTGGYGSTLTGGNRATLTGGDWVTLTGGDYSTLTGGAYSLLTGGAYSLLTGGNRSTLTGGEGSEFRCKYYDGTRYRTAVGYVGENGIEANVPYKVNGKGQFVKVG